MKLSHALLTIAFSVALAVPLAASANNPATTAAPGTALHHHHRNNFMRALRGVNLSPDQQSQIKSLMLSFKQSHPKGSAPDPAARKLLRQNVLSKLTPAQRAQFEQNQRQFRHHAKPLPATAVPEPTPTPS